MRSKQALCVRKIPSLRLPMNLIIPCPDKSGLQSSKKRLLVSCLTSTFRCEQDR